MIFRNRVKLGKRLLQNRVESLMPGLNTQRARLQPRHVEKLLHQISELVRLFVDDLDEILLRVRVPYNIVGKQRGGKALNRGERRAKLVGDHGEEHQLERVGFLSLTPRLLLPYQ